MYVKNRSCGSDIGLMVEEKCKQLGFVGNMFYRTNCTLGRAVGQLLGSRHPFPISPKRVLGTQKLVYIPTDHTVDSIKDTTQKALFKKQNRIGKKNNKLLDIKLCLFIVCKKDSKLNWFCIAYLQQDNHKSGSYTYFQSYR